MAFRALEPLELSELADLLHQRDYGAGYLDRETGTIYRAFEGEVLGDDGEPLHDEDFDLVALGGDHHQAEYDDMAMFAENVGDGRTRTQLREALHGRGAFRRFRDTLHQAPDDLVKAWYRYRDAARELRALEWLVGQGLVTQVAADPLITERERVARAALNEAAGGLQSGANPRLLLLNGLPGVGKSSLAAAYADRRPGTLLLDIDVVRTFVSGDPAAAAEPARAIGLAMAEAHLSSGHDVVVPQLIARVGQVARFEAAASAADASFVHVVVEAPEELRRARVAGDEAPHRQELDEERLAGYREGLADVVGSYPPAVRLSTANVQPDEAVASLLQTGAPNLIAPSAGDTLPQ